MLRSCFFMPPFSPSFFRVLGFCLVLIAWQRLSTARQDHTPWEMHTIDQTSQGADGVRLGDVNHDGFPDVVSGWEEGGLVRIYLNPGPLAVKKAWRQTTVGKVKSPEDAVLVDLDRDGRLDVVSCCEGKNRAVYFHWSPPTNPGDSISPKWQTQAVPAVATKQWMFAEPANIDHQHGIDLFIGSKGPNAEIGWLQSPANPRQLDQWKYHKLVDAGWIMSLRSVDVDGDRMEDLLVTDRKGKSRGVFYLKKSVKPEIAWRKVSFPGPSMEWMFLDWRTTGDSKFLAAATRDGVIVEFSLTVPAKTNLAGNWSRRQIKNPFEIRHGKAVSFGDIDLDGTVDWVHSTNTGVDKKNHGLPAVSWLDGKNPKLFYPISGSRGKKFDRMELVDLDLDGDLDVLTCEERDNLGVIWFENPTR